MGIWIITVWPYSVVGVSERKMGFEIADRCQVDCGALCGVNSVPCLHSPLPSSHLLGCSCWPCLPLTCVSRKSLAATSPHDTEGTLMRPVQGPAVFSEHYSGYTCNFQTTQWSFPWKALAFVPRAVSSLQGWTQWPRVFKTWNDHWGKEVSWAWRVPSVWAPCTPLWKENAGLWAYKRHLTELEEVAFYYFQEG